MYKKILVPMALDHGVSARTLEIAKSLADETGDIIALHVYEAPQGAAAAYLNDDTIKDGVAWAKAQLAEKTKGLDRVTAKMVAGHTYRTIIDYATAHDVDCIVMGSHKPSFTDYLLGSTAASVVRHAPCAVHVYRSS